MFNKNVFTQKDPIADLIKGINEADYKAKMEALKGNQHKLDKNKNNKVDADDFKILRGEKKAMKEEEHVEEAAESPFTSWKKPREVEPKGGSGVKQGSRYGGSKQKDKPEHDDEKVKKEETVTEGVSLKQKHEDKKRADQNQVRYGKMTQTEFDKKWTRTERPKPTDKEQGVAEGSVQDDPYKGTTPTSGKIAARNSHKLGKTYNNPHSPKYHKDSYAAWDRDYNNETARLKKKGVAEESDQIDELSKGETAEKERIVKGMKKSLAGFKARYGDKAKSVMYATATARAKK